MFCSLQLKTARVAKFQFGRKGGGDRRFTLRCPLRLMLVALRQVLGYRGESTLVAAAHMAGHAVTTVQDFDRMGCHTQLQR
jgi:hypothetical protein